MALVPVIAQLKPPAGQLKLIMTATMDSGLDEFVACNMDTNSDYIRFAIQVPETSGCCTLEDKGYILYDVEVSGNTTYSADLKDYMPRGTKLYVYSLNGNVAFTIFSHRL